MSKAMDLLALLSDGCFQTGDDLGKQLGLSRSGIWKLMNKLTAEFGVDCHKVKGRGYCVPGGIQFLEGSLISEVLSDTATASLSAIEILPTIDSTNAYLLSKLREGLPSGHACFAEYQSAGRGRRGRKWFSPFGCNIFLSLSWRFTHDFAALEGLTLCIAIAVVRALRAYGIEGVEVKWPNDIFVEGKKLAGILVEMQAVAHIETSVVVGVGLNVSMPEQSSEHLDKPFVDVKEIVGQTPDRNRLAGFLLNALLDVLSGFNQSSFSGFKDEWIKLDMLAGRAVELLVGENVIKGVARGVDDRGALLVETDGGLKSFHSGEVVFQKR